MKKILGVVLVTVVFAYIWPVQNVRANPFEYNWQQLAPGVWAAIRQDPFELPQEGNAVFVVTEQGVVVFDAGGYPIMGENIVAKVRSVTDKPITHVIISHWHGDHMRASRAFKPLFPMCRSLPIPIPVILSCRHRING